MKTVLTPPALVQPAGRELAKLAKAINRHHAACLDSARLSLEHAHQAGDALLAAKHACGHGHYLDWLAKHVKVGERQAERYVLIAKHWTRLKFDAKDGFGELGIQGFLDLLAGDNQDCHVLEAWEQPVSDTPTVIAAGQNIDTMLASLPPAAQCEVLARNEERLEQQEQASARRAGRDDRARRIHCGEAQIAKARRSYLGLGHEADRVVADLDAAARGSAELGSG